MLVLLFALGLASICIGLLACVEVSNRTLAAWITWVTLIIGIILCVGVIVEDGILRDEFIYNQTNACRMAGGAYVIFSDEIPGNLCVDSQNVILPDGWQKLTPNR